MSAIRLFLVPLISIITAGKTLISHLGSLRSAGCVNGAGFHTVRLVSATQSKAAFPPPPFTRRQGAVTPEHRPQTLINSLWKKQVKIT